MAIKKRHIHGAVTWAVLWAGIGIALAGDPHHDSGVITMEKEAGLLLQREKICSVAYASGKLTYISGESPDDAIFPEPVSIIPRKGLWAVDRGEDWQSWRLLGFEWNGRPRANINLVQKLGIENPDGFCVEAMTLNPDGRTTLLASLDRDARQQKYLDKRLFEISPDGNLLAEKKYRDFQSFGYLFILDGSRVLNLERQEAGDWAWFWYDSEQGKKTGPRSNSVEPVFVSNQIIERIAAREFRILSGGEEFKKPAYKGEDSLGGEPVCGQGHYFGFIKSEPKNHEDPEKEQIRETTRELEIFFWDDKKACIIKLAKVPIASRRLSSSDWSDFTYYREGQSCFDEEGNYYEIAWSAKDLTVFSYKMDNKKAGQILRASGR